MSGPVSFTDERWFADELTRHRQVFERGDYSGFMEALLLCCWNNRQLPEWVSTVVIQQAKEVFNRVSTGSGRHGNWRAAYNAIQIHKRRWELANFHLKARQRQGRKFVSERARLYGYGEPAQSGGNVVTREDVFKFVSAQLKGTPAQGSADAIEASYKAVKNKRPKRKRSKRPKRGGK